MAKLELSKKDLKLIDRALLALRHEISTDIKIFDSPEKDEFTETVDRLKCEYKDVENLRDKLFYLACNPNSLE